MRQDAQTNGNTKKYSSIIKYTQTRKEGFKYMHKIPQISFPEIKFYSIVPHDEPLMSISDAGILCDSQYYNEGIAGSYKDCYCRKTVLDKLKLAESYLPKGLKLKVYDAYRPICVQQRLWNQYYNTIKHNNLTYPEKKLVELTQFFVSMPSTNIANPSLHNTGGAVDVTLVDKKGNELDMGTSFDDFSEHAWTDYYEKHNDSRKIRKNRRILYNAMIKAGFTNLPSEWWHYDYGTKMWGYFTGNDALYYGILDFPADNRLPLE